MQAYNLVAQHIEECKETRKVMRDDVIGIRADLAAKHTENQNFQKWLLRGIVVVLLTILYDIIKSGHLPL